MPLLLKSMWANHNHSVPLSNVHPTISSWWRWIYIYFTRSIVLILLLMVTTTGGSSGSKEWKRGPLYCIIMTPSSPKRKVLHINDSMMWNSVKRFYFLPTNSVTALGPVKWESNPPRLEQEEVPLPLYKPSTLNFDLIMGGIHSKRSPFPTLLDSSHYL